MKLLGWADLEARGITLHRVSIHRLMREGKFPQAVKLGAPKRGGRIAWVESEIDEYLACSVAARDAKRSRAKNDRAPATPESTARAL